MDNKQLEIEAAAARVKTKIIIRSLRKMLDTATFRHSVRVAKTAASIAQRFNVDADKAYMAGLLHDCAKNDVVKSSDLPGIRLSK